MADAGATGAAVLYCAAVVVLLGMRSWQQWRATGSTGFNGFRGMARGAADRVAGICFVVAVVVGVASPVAAALDALPLLGRTEALRASGWVWLGLAVTVGGIVLGRAAQQAMGDAWRIGVDADEHTELVTTGLFRLVRNPIFTALIAVQAGTAVMAPTWLSILGVVLMVVGCQLQTRLVEEPYLLRSHGTAYLHYAARTGRFLPYLGRLSESNSHARSSTIDGAT